MMMIATHARAWRAWLLKRCRPSLGAKLGGVVLACMIAAIAVASVFFLHQAQIEADAKARLLARQAIDDTVERVRTELARSFKTASTTSATIVTLWSHGVRDRQVADVLLKGMLEDDPDRYGAWTVWKPDAYDGRDKAFVAAPGSDATGRYLTYWHQNGMEITRDNVRDYATEPLFRTPLDQGVAYFGEPFYIRSNDQRIAAVSYSEPIIADDKVVGAIGIDLALKALMDSLAAIPLPNGANILLASNAGTLISSNGAEVQERPLAAVRPDLTAELAKAENAGTLTLEVGTAAGPALVGWAPVNTLDKPWYLRTEIPIRAFAFDAARRQQPTIVALLGIVSAMMIAIVIALRLLVARPLERIETFVKRLRDGIDSVCPETGRGDEIGAIARALSEFRHAEEEVGRLRQAEQAREHRFADLRRTELRQLANHLAATVQNVARIVDATTRKIMRRAEAMTAAAVTSSERTKIVADASSVADISVGTVDTATVALRAAIERIDTEMRRARMIASEAADQARTSGVVTEALSNQASRIGEIVALISSIAQRTNMLALNATIEAARAGETGRGFAVVAQEVKALASQTTAATVEVGRQIEAMQATATQAADALSAIGGHVAALDNISGSVAGAVYDQGEATDLIGRSVGDAVAASRGVSLAIGEFDRAASRAGDAAAEMLIDIAQLNEEVARLDDEVADAIARIRAA